MCIDSKKVIRTLIFVQLSDIATPQTRLTGPYSGRKARRSVTEGTPKTHRSVAVIYNKGMEDYVWGWWGRFFIQAARMPLLL